MIAAVLLPGTSLARQADHSSQQAPSQSGDKSGSELSERCRTPGRKWPGSFGEKLITISKRSASLTKTTTKRPSSTIHSQPAVSHPRRLNKTPATNGARIDTPGIVTGPQRTGSKTASPSQTKRSAMAACRLPSSHVAVNGQQFKNSRDPGAHLGNQRRAPDFSGGTAVINGTDMKRKP